MARKPTDEVQLKLRFSEALRRQLERVAARNNRSMNAEIIHRLEMSFRYGPEIVKLPSGTVTLRFPPSRPADDARPLTVDEKLDRIITVLEAEKSKDDGEKK